MDTLISSLAVLIIMAAFYIIPAIADRIERGKDYDNEH